MSDKRSFDLPLPNDCYAQDSGLSPRLFLTSAIGT
jgi:hypothetical protein